MTCLQEIVPDLPQLDIVTEKTGKSDLKCVNLLSHVVLIYLQGHVLDTLSNEEITLRSEIKEEPNNC